MTHIHVHDFLIASEITGRSLEFHLAGGHYVKVVGHRQRLTDVLFHHQDSDAALRQCASPVQGLLIRERVKALSRAPGPWPALSHQASKGLPFSFSERARASQVLDFVCGGSAAKKFVDK